MVTDLLNFTLENDYKQIEDLYLHDSELEKIMVDYKKKEIRFLFHTAKISQVTSKRIEFIFERVNDFICPMREPWGSGFYIHSVSVEKTTDDYLKVTFLLNSGDEISCKAELVKTNASLLN